MIQSNQTRTNKVVYRLADDSVLIYFKCLHATTCLKGLRQFRGTDVVDFQPVLSDTL